VLRICWIHFTLTSSDQTSTNASSFLSHGGRDITLVDARSVAGRDATRTFGEMRAASTAFSVCDS
jgi:hypothetical protein